MKLYQMVFPSTTICDKGALYYRIDGNGQIPLDGYSKGITLHNGQTLSTDTYYNCLSYATYCQYTNINNMSIAATIQGKATVKAMRVFTEGNIELNERKKSDFVMGNDKTTDYTTILLSKQVQRQVLATTEVDCSSPRTVTLDFAIDGFDSKEYGVIYLEATANADNVVFWGAEYLTQDNNCHNVKVGVVICTFKREQYVKQTVSTVGNFLQQNADISDNLGIFVIDNGKTLSQEDVPYATLIPNANLGGSGGFTRGIMEVYARKDQYTHFLVMDDDIVFEPEILRKTISLLRYEKQRGNLSVGAGMLQINQPNCQLEGGTTWDGISFHAKKSNFDLLDINALLANEVPQKVAYSGWWYMCMSVDKVDKHGLPLPLFIKWDDVEYGHRCCTDIAITNGIGVMHEPFDHKYSAHLEYYSLRNGLYTYALHKNKGMMGAYKRLFRLTAYRTTQQRYYETDLIFRAYNDFLRGAKFLLNCNGEALNTALIKSNYPQYTKEQLEEQGYNVDQFYPPVKVNLLWSALTLNGYLLPTDGKKYRVVPVANYNMGQYYRAKRVVNFNPATQKGFVTVQRRGQLVKTAFRLFGMWFKLFFGYRRAAKSMKKQLTRLTSFENWRKLLKID